MQSIITELYYLWNEQGEMPYRTALERGLDRLHRLSEQYADSEQLWDACMESPACSNSRPFKWDLSGQRGCAGNWHAFARRWRQYMRKARHPARKARTTGFCWSC